VVDRPAGDFGTWLDGMVSAVRDERESDVPCDGCTACCEASQFVHIAPDETDTLAHIPAALRFPAPGLPAGHVVLGYDEHGRCPMLTAGGCSIYAHRPRACRTYDCRVFPAAGVEIDEPAKAAVAARAAQWRFRYADAEGRRRHDAVRAAAAYLGTRGDELPARSRPLDATGRAVLAVEIHEVFLDDPDPPAAAVRVALRPRRS
jgi:Fe-S-cluster containining protein